MNLVFESVANSSHAAAAAAPALSPAARPDVLAWATWLQGAGRGEQRSRTLLLRDLVRRGIWAAADEPSAGAALAPQMQGWSPYEVALACAAVAMLGPVSEATVDQMAWSRSGLQAALRRAADAPMVSTPDGAPMLWACRVVWAASLSAREPGAAREQQARLLQTLVQDPGFDGVPLAWKRVVWGMAADHHRLCGQTDLECHYLDLLAAKAGGATALLARLRMGWRNDSMAALSASAGSVAI